MHQGMKAILIDEITLQKRIKKLGEQITKDYRGKNPLIICILKGAVLFMADLVQKIDTFIEMDFMATSSYGASIKSSGEVRILKDLDKSVEGRDVLIVEDIVDSGLTLSYIMRLLKDRRAHSIKVCTLLEKPARRIAEVEMDYVGFKVPNEFVVGYGLDYDEKYRNLPYIGVLKEEIYNEQL
ncbi:MAG: hypoxanthine phosphoribosyltransferase [Eubacteriales bacterium]